MSGKAIPGEFVLNMTVGKIIPREVVLNMSGIKLLQEKSYSI